MADPQIPLALRVLAIFQGSSLLPEDRYVNTWAFLRDPLNSIETDYATIANWLDEFYCLPVAPASNKITTYMPRSLVSLEFRIYNLQEPPPRVPEIIPSTEYTRPTLANALPTEVATTLSFVSERNLPRRRGRIYIGPLVQTAAATDSEGEVTVGTGLRDVVQAAAGRLLDNSELTGFPTWCVLSQADNAMYPVTGGWFDDAFDTQRRRGIAARGRVQFGTYTS